MNNKQEATTAKYPQSVVIVRNQHGTTATLRFDDARHDRVMSSVKHSAIYWLIESYVKGL